MIGRGENEDLFDADQRDMAQRWQDMDRLVRELKEFGAICRTLKNDKGEVTLNDQGKERLLSLVQQVNASMPPTVSHKLIGWEYREAIANLEVPLDGLGKEVVNKCDRWTNVIRKICRDFVPGIHQYEPRRSYADRGNAVVRDVHATVGELRELVDFCEDDLSTIETQFPRFYQALQPYCFAAHLLKLKDAAKQTVEDQNSDYESAVKSFTQDSINADMLATRPELKRMIEKSIGDSGARKILGTYSYISPVVLPIMLPSTQNKYSKYTTTLAGALRQDVQVNYGGDSAKMALDNPNAYWLERMYAYRWTLAAAGVADQLNGMKEQLRMQPRPKVDFSSALAEKNVRDSGQQGFPGF